jgi:hypothetical protein
VLFNAAKVHSGVYIYIYSADILILSEIRLLYSQLMLPDEESTNLYNKY